jgi:hypothetical protein
MRRNGVLRRRPARSTPSRLEIVAGVSRGFVALAAVATISVRDELEEAPASEL